MQKCALKQLGLAVAKRDCYLKLFVSIGHTSTVFVMFGNSKRSFLYVFLPETVSELGTR